MNSDLKTYGIALGALLILGGWYFLAPANEYIDKPTVGENIIAFGDSLVEGVGATYGNDFVSILSKRLNAPIINAGISGDTTETALLRLSNHVLSQNPKIVILLLGGNDALRRIPLENTFNTLSIIIDRIHAQGAAVLLIGVRGGILGDKYKSEFKKLANEKKVSFVSNILDDIFAHSDLMHDAIHPNDKGHLIMAERIEPILKKMLGK